MSPAEELRYLIFAAQREGNRAIGDASRSLDLSPSQAEVVRVLQDHQPLSLVELGDLLVCENGSPSRLVDGLVKAGLVERTVLPTDKRKVTLSLSHAGEDAARGVAAIEAQFYATIDRLIDPPTSAILRAALWTYLDNTESGKTIARRKALNQK